MMFSFQDGTRRRFATAGPVIVRLSMLALLTLSCLALPVQSADSDLQLWFPMQLIHPVDEHWELSMQIEPRLQNDISDFSQLVYKPAVNYHFNRTFAFSAGYKYIDKYHEANEQDIWQETHFQLLINTKAKRIKKPTVRDRYR